ncbi:hypothetical protein [Burkholderia sp. LMG 32019]|uniref:hypothetical protein n=1 Tax=Burkholderia sp. LMG 32019 TaxID=3158173 RepID=UPI003C2B3BD7
MSQRANRNSEQVERLTALPLAALMALGVHAQQASTPEDRAAAACANAGQDRQAQQQRDAAVRAPSLRSDVPRAETYLPLPREQPCFHVDRFSLDLPDSRAEACTKRVALDGGRVVISGPVAGRPGRATAQNVLS